MGSRVRVLIADDEPVARRGIRQLLAPHADVEIAGEARNGAETVRLLRTLEPDVLFLDIQMPELDGFEVLSRLEDRRAAVIFVTAYDSFAVEAFETNAVDYLVKPVVEKRFETALQRARDRLRSQAALDLSGVVSALAAQRRPDPSRQAARRLMIGAPGSDVVVDIREITCIAAADYYAAVHFAGKRSLVRESLDSLEKRLDQEQFVRTHRGFIVNLAAVAEVRSPRTGDSTIVLRDGTKVPLSRRRRRDVEAALRRFAR